MLFNSFAFLVLFSLTFFIYYLPAFWQLQIVILVISSLIFYSWDSPPLLVLLLLSIFINGLTSFQIASASRRKKITWLLIGLSFNLLILSFFKYGALIANLFSINLAASEDSIFTFLLRLPLPIGISFYTFEGLSLLIDVLRTKPNQEEVSFVDANLNKHLLNTSFFIAFFPHLIAGLILKANNFYPQIKPKYQIGFNVTNLGMSGGSTQTGLEVVHRTFSKPTILLVEINETIIIKADKQIVNSIYNPVLYYTRLHIPMLRQEYKPVGTFLATVSYLKKRLKEVIRRTAKPTDSKLVGNIDPNLTEKLISQAIEDYKTPLSDEEKTLFAQEAEYIKSQISQIKKDGVRVILFDIPREQRVEATVREKQLKALMRKLFPTNSFEWLPEPPPRHWTTYDGFHLIGSDTQDYAAFIGNQLLLKSLTVD